MITDKAAVVGAFVLGGLALAVVAILLFGKARLFEPTERAVVFFQGSVAGLDVGAPVTFRGVRVGSVQQIALRISTEGRARIPVHLELLPDKVILERDPPSAKPPKIEEFVAAGLRAQLGLQSFVTGQLRVDLDFRPDTPAQLTAIDTGGIPQIPSLASDLERLRATFTDLPLQDLAQATLRTLAAVERLASHLDARVDAVVDNAQRGFDGAARTFDTAEQAVANIQADASRTLGTLDKLLTHADRQLGDRGAELARALTSADRIARQAERLLSSIDSLVAPESRTRADVEAAVRDLAAAASSLRGFAREIERNPGLLLRGRYE
jgi:phospholipid/cholesterol/gamma-HCH transport system substrate-binding protein